MGSLAAYRKFFLTLAIVMAGIIWPRIYVIPSLGQEGTIMLGITMIAALLWMTEALSLGITGLVVILLQALTRILPLQQGLAFIAHPVNAIVLVGFLLARSLVKSGLDKRISLHIIKGVGERTSRIMLGLMVASAFLSMWMSNTATTAIMVPIALGILGMVEAEPLHSKLGKGMVIGIAYAANVGGMGTPTGTPANPITIAFLRDIVGIQLSFLDWLLYALPLVIVLIPMIWLMLLAIYPHEVKIVPGGAQLVQRQLKQLGVVSRQEKKVLCIFALAIVLWLSDSFFPLPTDWLYLVAVFLTIFIVLPKVGTLSWQEAQGCIGWDVLFLVGGGLAMGSGLLGTGVIHWIADSLSIYITQVGLGTAILIISASTALGITVFCSLSGTATTFVPLSIGLALGLGADPVIFAVVAGLSSSFAFILPANAAPNAIAYGSGYFKTIDMARSGVFVVLVSILSLWGVSLIFYN